MAERRGRGRPRVKCYFEPYPQRERTPEPIPPTNQNLEGDNLTAQAIHQLLQFLQQQNNQPQNQNNQGTTSDSHDRVLERFLRFDPPIFLGEPDDVKAEIWLEKIESIFSALNYTDDQKLRLMAFRLEGDSRNWWQTVEEKWNRTETERTWDNFVQEFRKQYIPQVVREARRDEFYHLRQGAMTVAQYESEFHRLSKYVPGSVNEEEDKLYKFTRGLRQEIQKQLLSVEINTYDVAVRAAARVESGLSRLESQLKVNINNTKKSFAGQASKKPQQFLKGGVKDLKGKGKQGQILVCSYCNKPGHTPEQCWRKAGKCLRCGSGQHQVKDCPVVVQRDKNAVTLPQSGNKNGSRPKMQGRVFALAGQEAPEANDVVEDTGEDGNEEIEEEFSIQDSG